WMSDSQAVRLLFMRIAFVGKTDFNLGSQTWMVKLIVLSVKGLLIELPESWTGYLAGHFEVDIRLCNVAHVKIVVDMTHD
ncbi:PilZ domain-containing protein, partial [Pseudomonas syringae pv. tagetis]